MTKQNTETICSAHRLSSSCSGLGGIAFPKCFLSLEENEMTVSCKVEWKLGLKNKSINRSSRFQLEGTFWNHQNNHLEFRTSSV